MRSRDGNSYFSWRLCTLILLTSLALNASEYLISYKYIVKDAVLYNEALYVSKAMRKCGGKPQNELVIENTSSKDLKKILSQNSQEFLDFIQNLALHIENKEITTNLNNSFITSLTLKTTCFKVDFNDNFVKIAPLK